MRSDRRSNRLDTLLRAGEALEGLLCHHDPVHRDFEDATAARDQYGFECECLADCVRRTGGARLVVSSKAVSDGKHLGSWESLP